MINVKAALKQGELIEAYNTWNKKFHIPVKTVGQVRDSFQLMPDTRALIPTGLTPSIPEGHVLKLYSDSNTVLHKGLVLSCGVQVMNSGEEQLHIIVSNVTDSLVVIANGNILAQGFLEKIIDDTAVVV